MKGTNRVSAVLDEYNTGLKKSLIHNANTRLSFNHVLQLAGANITSDKDSEFDINLGLDAINKTTFINLIK